MDWRHAYEVFYDLPEKDQHRLLEAIKNTLFPENTNLTGMLKEIRETRFSSGMACVHCGSKAVKRNGKYKTRQLYLCKDCGKSFNDTTASPLSGTHYPQKWLK